MTYAESDQFGCDETEGSAVAGYRIAWVWASAFERPTLKVALLLVVAIWCFCRAYYFAFYVLEHYIDPDYRFSGLISFARYMVAKKRD